MNIAVFEDKAIKMLCSTALGIEVLNEVLTNPEKIECDFTGVGYFLTLHHKNLPTNRIICDTPNLIGNHQKLLLGFIVFIENNELSLECFNYGDERVTEHLRNEPIQISKI